MSTNKPRLRDLGISIGTLPTGPLNAITDVPGVRVGVTTLIEGDGPLVVGQGPVRTGVTAIHPHEGSTFLEQVPAAIDVLNGAGEMTGHALVDEYGLLSSPVLITNTLSVGAVHQATVEWMSEQHPEIGPREWVAPVIAETYDGALNDVAGQHVHREHVRAALDSATAGPVPEGNVGGGTGMLLFGFKGGTGTSSRQIEVDGKIYTVGVLVQGNFGSLPDLLVDGVPVGRVLEPTIGERNLRFRRQQRREGSIITIIATDAPFSERQLGRLCRRGMLGLGRVGSTAGHGSGDILLAFSNAPENRVPRWPAGPLLQTTRLADEWIGPFFSATIDATSEAVLNAMVAAETMTGRDGITAHALPHDELQAIMRQHGR
ncbi:MAG TPA: P1 family peptidase [Thermomicrobiales bacterium]|nr:P1 family peptidase [Thermomicrobiales bacterium]